MLKTINDTVHNKVLDVLDTTIFDGYGGIISASNNLRETIYTDLEVLSWSVEVEKFGIFSVFSVLLSDLIINTGFYKISTGNIIYITYIDDRVLYTQLDVGIICNIKGIDLICANLELIQESRLASELSAINLYEFSRVKLSGILQAPTYTIKWCKFYDNNAVSTARLEKNKTFKVYRKTFNTIKNIHEVVILHVIAKENDVDNILQYHSGYTYTRYMPDYAVFTNIGKLAATSFNKYYNTDSYCDAIVKFVDDSIN